VKNYEQKKNHSDFRYGNHSWTWSDNKVRELTTAVAFKVLPLGSYAPVPAPSPSFKTILELVLWNGPQNCRCITPDIINVNKMPSFQCFLYLREQNKVSVDKKNQLDVTICILYFSSNSCSTCFG
jgi:hypothetical protein